jgi:hypothetical protein
MRFETKVTWQGAMKMDIAFSAFAFRPFFDPGIRRRDQYVRVRIRHLL